jgi:hypothetical protein
LKAKSRVGAVPVGDVKVPSIVFEKDRGCWKDFDFYRSLIDWSERKKWVFEFDGSGNLFGSGMDLEKVWGAMKPTVASSGKDFRYVCLKGAYDKDSDEDYSKRLDVSYDIFS